MGRRQRNKQQDPPSINGTASQQGKKRKNEDKTGPNSKKIKPDRLKVKKPDVPKTRVAGKPVKPSTIPTKELQQKPQKTIDTTPSDDIPAEKAALFDSDEEEDDPKAADNEDDWSDEEEGDVMQSDEEDARRAGMFSDSDDEELLTAANMESMSRKIDERAEEDAELAAQELAESGNMPGPQILPDGSLAEAEAEDLNSVGSRLQEIVRVLTNFKTLAEEGKSRAEYLDQFKKDVIVYFGYSEYLATRFLDMFSPAEALAFFEANETPRPIVIRVNTLKTTKRELSKALIDRGVNLGDVGKWTRCALQIFESSVPIGATPEYLAGHYILQAASSLVPVLALKPGPDDRVLDMASAPGGKTSFLAQEMKNGGIVIANEINKKRQKSLVGNVVRMGCRNVIGVSFDGREFGAGKTGLGTFDKILLDAPCSGTGVIHKDPSVKTNRTEKDFQVVSQLQRQLLLSAIDSLKVDGVVVYSTCSVMVDEDEMVVDYALRNRDVKLEVIEVAVGEAGHTTFREKKFHPTMGLTKRFYPHVHNMDGFFVARIRKVSSKKVAGPAAVKADVEQEEDDVVDGGDETDNQEEKSPFDAEEDVKYIEKHKKETLKKKGLNPQSLNKKKGDNLPEDEAASELLQEDVNPGTKQKSGQKAKVNGKPRPRARAKIIDYSKPQKPEKET